MILTADSGSTKTEWLISNDSGNTAIKQFVTPGINPTLMPESVIDELIANVILEHEETKNATQIEFYGSGCTKEASTIMAKIIKRHFKNAGSIIVDSDIIGAAKALLGTKEGIACILGTGANSCLWNGKEIEKQTPCLGYILGDEGGGAVLGRSLLNILFKGGSTPVNADGTANKLYELRNEFMKEYGMSMADVIQRVYRQPNANRWLASLSPFISANLGIPEIKEMLTNNFRNFFRCNIKPYNRPELPVNFVGSIAFYYQEQLSEAAKAEGLTIGRIIKSPFS